MRFIEETAFEWKSGCTVGRFLHIGESFDSGVNLALIQCGASLKDLVQVELMYEDSQYTHLILYLGLWSKTWQHGFDRRVKTHKLLKI